MDNGFNHATFNGSIQKPVIDNHGGLFGYHGTQGSRNSSILDDRESKPVDSNEFEKSK